MIENIIYILIAILLITLIYAWCRYETPSEKEYNKKLKESLEDEYIVDPETGTKITLEQAETGNWTVKVEDESEFSVMPYDELKKIPTEETRTAQTAINYLRSSTFFRLYELTDEEFEVFEKTEILNGYDDWHYSHPYKFDNGILILTVGELNNTDYKESYIMVCIKISDIKGHYLFKEKTNTERFFDLIRKDDDIVLKDYESLTIKKSHNISYIKTVLKNIVNEKGLEIEIHNDNLFIQTLKLVNVYDLKRLETLLNTIPT